MHGTPGVCCCRIITKRAYLFVDSFIHLLFICLYITIGLPNFICFPFSFLLLLTYLSFKKMVFPLFLFFFLIFIIITSCQQPSTHRHCLPTNVVTHCLLPHQPDHPAHRPSHDSKRAKCHLANSRLLKGTVWNSRCT